MIKFSIPEKLDKRATFTWLASGAGLGFISPAPGTWGSIGGLIVGIFIFNILGFYFYLFTLGVLFFLGIWSADKFDSALGIHDSKMIVIDEVVGQMIAMLPVLFDFSLILTSFVAFRVFDIFKPWPVSYFDKEIENSYGVMMDDVVAGLLAAVCMMVFHYVF